MSEYEKLNKEHAARMKQFGDDLKLIRARVRAERSGLLPRQELSKIEILEARYNEKVSSFSRVFAEALFNSYLLEISGLTQAGACDTKGGQRNESAILRISGDGREPLPQSGCR